MKGILIRTGGHGLWKGVYAGNLDTAYQQYLRLKEKYSGFTVTYHNADDPEFVSALIDMPGLIEVI